MNEPKALLRFSKLRCCPHPPNNSLRMQGVAVRDLKLENILLDRADSLRPLLKICDFGLSKVTALRPSPIVQSSQFYCVVLLCPAAVKACAAAVLLAFTCFGLTAA